MSSGSTPAKPDRAARPSPGSAGSRKRRSSATEDITPSSSPRNVRLKPSAETNELYEEQKCRISTQGLAPLERSFRRYYDQTWSDRLLIVSLFDLMEQPRTELSQGTIHLSGIVEPMGYTRLGYADDAVDGRRSRLLLCKVCGPPVFEDFALFQTRHPKRILDLIQQFLHNQRRVMRCLGGQKREDDEEFVEVAPRPVRHLVALLTYWASLEPYDSSGELRQRWRSKIRGLLEEALFRPTSFQPGQILRFQEHEVLFKAFFLFGGIDHGVLDESQLQVVRVTKRSQTEKNSRS